MNDNNNLVILPCAGIKVLNIPVGHLYLVIDKVSKKKKGYVNTNKSHYSKSANIPSFPESAEEKILCPVCESITNGKIKIQLL